MEKITEFYLEYFRTSQPNAYWAINQMYLPMQQLQQYFDVLIKESRQPNNFGRILMYVQLAGENYINDHQSAIFRRRGGRLIVSGLESISARTISEQSILGRYTHADIHMLSIIYATAFLEIILNYSDPMFADITNMGLPHELPELKLAANC